jgi:hypothetical protein
MPRCGVTFSENGVAQTAAFRGLRLSVSESRTAADQPKKTAGPRYTVYLKERFHVDLGSVSGRAKAATGVGER